MPRRVVTGRNAAGRSVVVSDADIEPTVLRSSPDAPLYDVWGAAGTEHLPTDGTRPPLATWFPPAGGFRYLIATFPPDATPAVDLDPEDVLADMEEKVPGAAAHYDPDAAGMHTTQSVDVGVVLAGEINLELDDGLTVRLGPGDLVVQNATRHAWRNPTDTNATVAFVLIGTS